MHFLEVFFKSMGSLTSLKRFVSHLREYVYADFHAYTPYMLSQGRPEPCSATLLCHPIGTNAHMAVQEYQPVVHRLRLLTSP